MAISLTAVDEIDDKLVTGTVQIWPVSADRDTAQPIEGTYSKHPETGDIIVGVDDPDEIGGVEVVIRLSDAAGSEYTGSFDEDGCWKKK